MDFGKTSNADDVNWTYPEEIWIKSPIVSVNPKKNESEQILYIGGTSWVENNWKNVWYPSKSTPKDFLYHYSRQFHTIELNTTFYQIPSADTVFRWIEKTPEDFRFCPKFYHNISRNINKIDLNILDQFLKMLENFGKRLGCSFLQLPGNYSIKESQYLFSFLNDLPTDFRVAIEFRHPDWFAPSGNFPVLMLHNLNKHTVITDVGGRRDVCHLKLSGDQLIIRFVGNNLHITDYSRIQKWITIMQYWFSKGINKIYFFIHQPENNFTPELAYYLGTEWEKQSFIPTKYPSKINGSEQQRLEFLE